MKYVVSDSLYNDRCYLFCVLVVDECATSNGGCEHICVRSQVGHHCECSHGYELGFDHQSCDGITIHYVQFHGSFTNISFAKLSYIANCTESASVNASDCITRPTRNV